MRLPAEAGEKPFALEEELNLPASCPKIHKLIRYSLHPELIDQKVMAGKAVFRGAAILHILYCDEDGGIHNWDFEIPFSQFTELDADYDQDATVTILPAVTALELELGEEGTLRLKAGLTGQYVVWDMHTVDVIEDAYSPYRTVKLQTEQLELPVLLEEKRETLRVEQTAELSADRVIDVAFYPEAPALYREQDGVTAELGGAFQMLYYDQEGNLQGATPRWSDTWNVPADPASRVDVTIMSSGIPQGVAGGTDISLRSDVVLDAATTMQKGLSMITGLSIGEMTEPDPERPSLILRRAGEESLWQLAKESGSTVAAIEKANQLQDEPEFGRMLLIPVM